MKDNGGDPDKTAFGYLIFWSDGFVTSWVKRKDGSCWCMTVTVAPPHDNDRSIFHTHCIALGRKGGDHNKVIVEKLDELDEIRKRKMRYDGITGKWINTSFDIIMYMADRPERNEILRTLSHQGVSSKRFRYAAYTDAEKLPPCKQCFRSMLEDVLNDNGSMSNECSDEDVVPAGATRLCKRCCNFEYCKGEAWERSAPLRANYPNNMTEDTRNKIGAPEGREVMPGIKYVEPREQSFEWMTKGVNVTLEELERGNWVKANANGDDYLHSFALNDSLRATVVAEGLARGVKRKAGELYTTKDVLPAIWSKGYDLRSFIDCPMHCEFSFCLNQLS